MRYKSNRKGLLQYFGIPHHEYWSWWWFSVPVWPWWIWYAIKLRKSTWFTAVNPGIEHSGYTEESKMEILNMIPHRFVPITEYVAYHQDMKTPQLPFPFIVKPDIGGRGRKIKIIHNNQELLAYHRAVGEDYLIQEIIPYELEFGVFYARIPGSPQGRILSLTEKGFLSVIGDGALTLSELMEQDGRARSQIERLKHSLDSNRIPWKGEKVLIEPIGNHCRGTTFINRNDLITESLCKVFDQMVSEMNGFYYGRFDLRVKSLADFYAGKNIYVLELNGLTSMDTHIFDPTFRLRDVVPVLINNCKICYEIAKENLAQQVPTTPLSVILKKSLAFFKE